MKNNASLVYNACLVVGDFLALVTAFVVAYVLRVKLAVGINEAPLGPSNGRAFIVVFLAVLPFWIFIFALLGLYNSNIYEKRFSELGRLFVGSFIGLLFVIFWNFLASKPIFPARLVPIYGFAFGFLFLVIFRNLARFIRVSLFKKGTGLTRVLLVGNTAMTHELLAWLNGSRSGYRVVGVVGGELRAGEKSTSLYKTFDTFLEHYKGELHGIIQTELYADETKNAQILDFAQENHIGYRFVPGNTELFVGNIEVELFRSSIPVITVHQTALFGWGRVVKRLSDLLLGGSLLLIASPVLLLVALAEKIAEPKGSIFYKPERLSRFGGTVRIYKFRSMYPAYTDMSPEEGFTKMGRPELIKEYREGGDKIPGDPRITRLGKFLRQTSLDELPQLINVVRGDLSLVGPRALDPFELEKHPKKNQILAVKTGLTGLAQVSGLRDISFEERRKLDLYYVQHWSIWLDVTILLKTIRAVITRGNAN
ncbi:MAG TPA: exopolysaccharide biosynthesis polyprenyl glycosylphosphotransferase [Candidatus Saccharimonadales bacterium]|nr:exopolysaccharide biosynthesis polyprenyl glycosylphosphotransferase [Candidatus Saccharimonadales bacterium]